MAVGTPKDVNGHFQAALGLPMLYSRINPGPHLSTAGGEGQGRWLAIDTTVERSAGTLAVEAITDSEARAFVGAGRCESTGFLVGHRA